MDVLRRKQMKRTAIVAMLAIMLALIAGCKVEPDTGASGTVITEEEQAALDSYIGAFGHVRVLGDIDHILKGEKVDDEEGVTVQSMIAGATSFNENKTELSIPLTLKAYDFDGHRNPEDPSPEKYTRTATGALTLVLTGAVNAEGTGFVATGYRLENASITLSVDDSEYIWLDLPDMKLEADELTGIFTTSGGVAKSSVNVALTDGKPAGITDVNTPKFGTPAGNLLVNGKSGAVL